MDRIGPHTLNASYNRCTICAATREEIEDNLAPLCDARSVGAMHEANQARFMGGHASAPWIPHTYRSGPGCIYCGAAKIDVEAKRVSPGCNMHMPQAMSINESWSCTRGQHTYRGGLECIYCGAARMVVPETDLKPDIEAIRRVRPDLSGVIDDYLALTTVAVGEIVQVKHGETVTSFFEHCLVVVTGVRPWGVIGYHYGIGRKDGSREAGGVFPIRLGTEEFTRTGGRVTTHPPGAVIVPTS
jgi:hypothetical protein